MSINVHFVPAVDVLVLDLNGMNKSSRTVGASQVFDTSRETIAFSAESSLGLGNHGLDADCRARRCNIVYTSLVKDLL